MRAWRRATSFMYLSVRCRPDLGVEVSCTEVGARDISLKILGSRKLPAKSQFKVVLQSALGQDKVCLFSGVW